MRVVPGSFESVIYDRETPPTKKIQTGEYMPHLTIRHSVFVFTVIFLASCASSHILVGTQRPPIEPSLVKIYSKPPSKYEEIAIVSASSKSSWAITDQGKLEKVVERLKAEAASLGANGVIIQGVGDHSGAMVGQTYGSGTTFMVPAIHKNGQGMAILVTQE